MATDVFISYRRKDSEFVAQLHQELIKRDISAWFDQENIETADHWRSSIAEGIRDCKIFILVLSPDAVVSKNIRKEVDLAEDHNKKIIPLIWRQTDIPPAFEYALAGVQWIEFNETASQENFDQLADVVKRLIGGLTLNEATRDKEIAKETTIPSLPKEETAAPEPAAGPKKLGGRRKLGGGRKLGGFRPKQNPLVINSKVISKVITAADLDLDVEDEDYLNGELKWLFNAVNHFYGIIQDKAAIDDPIPVERPPDAEYTPAANNALLPQYQDSDLVKDAGKTLDGYLEGINDHLKILDMLVESERFGGEEAKRNVNLQSQIKEQRLDIVKILDQIAAAVDYYFEIKATTPRQLKELLEKT